MPVRRVPFSGACALARRLPRWAAPLRERLVLLVFAAGFAWRSFRERRDLDVVQCYHHNVQTGLLGWILRRTAPRAAFYVKLDMDPAAAEGWAKAPEGMRRDRLRGALFRRTAPDLVTSESRELAEFLSREHPDFRERAPIRALPNGIDLRELPATAGASPSSSERDPVVMYAGRVTRPQKRSDVLLRAFAAVAPKHPGWKLVLAGPVEPDIAREMDDLVPRQLEGRVEILGPRPHHEVLQRLARATLIAMPSEYEGFSHAALEGVACGCVLVGTDIPSFRAVTDGGALGRLLPRGDERELAAALDDCMSAPQATRELGARAAAFARTRFGWENLVRELDGWLRTAVVTRRASREAL